MRQLDADQVTAKRILFTVLLISPLGVYNAFEITHKYILLLYRPRTIPEAAAGLIYGRAALSNRVVRSCVRNVSGDVC